MQLLIKYSSFSDVRSKQEYDESHVITARRVKKVSWESQNLGQAGCLTEDGKSEKFYPRSRRWHLLLGHFYIQHEGLPHVSHTPEGAPPTTMVNSFIKQKLI